MAPRHKAAGCIVIWSPLRNLRRIKPTMGRPKAHAATFLDLRRRKDSVGHPKEARCPWLAWKRVALPCGAVKIENETGAIWGGSGTWQILETGEGPVLKQAPCTVWVAAVGRISWADL